MKKNNYIQIFDTTLRDGQQCPGAGMSFADNIKYANLAMQLGVDVLEAGFPSASKLDFDIVNTIAKELSPQKDSPIICGLCQLREPQIDLSIQSLKPAVKYGKARLHTYVPVSPALLQASLGYKGKDKKAIIKNLTKFTKKIIQEGLEVEFSPEGYSEMGENFDFVTDLIRAAVEAGAVVINCPDTIGGAHRLQGEEYFVKKLKKHAEILKKEFPNKKIIWSTHCHNDFGVAVENTINSVFEGPVRQIECCINGLGERAGNASLEQCVMIINYFSKYQKESFFTNIKTNKIKEISDFVSQKMLNRQYHFPITGKNAVRHTSGGHTNAILKNILAYQPFDPKIVGNEISLIFGPLSGGNHAQSIIEKNGYICRNEDKAKIAQFIKDEYADRRKGITDEELMQAYLKYIRPININHFDYSKSANSSSVHLIGKFFDLTGKINQTHHGKGSALSALQDLIDSKFSGVAIYNYQSHSDNKGIDAKSVCTIRINYKNNFYDGTGVDDDIEISAMKALIDAVNKAYEEKYKNK